MILGVGFRVVKHKNGFSKLTVGLLAFAELHQVTFTG